MNYDIDCVHIFLANIKNKNITIALHNYCENKKQNKYAIH